LINLGRDTFREWQELDEGNHPRETSKQVVNYMWDEWDGMRGLDAAQAPKLEAPDLSRPKA